MVNFLKKEPALVTAGASLLTVILGIFIHNPELVGAMVATFVALMGVRQIVVPVTTAATQITQAATTAATDTVKQLGSDTVGAVGNVTKAASDIIDNTVNQTVGNLLGGSK